LPLPERQLIPRLRQRTASLRRAGLIMGVGDDAAILELGRGDQLLVTTDLSIERVHFRRDWQSPEAIGHRALARGLSDIAAMGGEPFAAFLSVALPPGTSQRWFERFLDGFLKLGAKYRLPLAGGDTSAARSAIAADVVVLGRVPKGTAIRRSGAKPGDLVFVTGTLGAAAVNLRKLRNRSVRAAGHMPLPEPRIAVGLWLRKNRLPTAMIDLSDGLSTDLSHICNESGVGAAILESAVPRAAGATLEDAIHGGEDYELLFTVPKSKPIPDAIAGIPVSPIGEIVRSRRATVRILSRGRWRTLLARGWQHFG
jgi:thiamine-monophosphate kinase